VYASYERGEIVQKMRIVPCKKSYGHLPGGEVADSLVISEGAVKNHLSNIFGCLGLCDRTQAVIYARERGLL
jgi:DNA-binding CsgD family transcriptional regulator